MIKEIQQIKMPAWLSSGNFNFNLKEVLADSLYYPSCGTDGMPVQYFMGNVYSFIYVDYGIAENVFLEEINMENSFKGYKIISIKEIPEKQLYDENHNVFSHNKQYYMEQFKDYVKEPYCYWVIFERKETYNEEHNPKRFSLLYFCSEAVSAYYGLYKLNNMSPKIFCIIQDGSGFGCNWTSFKERNAPMALVIFSNNKSPEYLVNGGYQLGYEDPIWSEYSKKIYYKCLPYIYEKGKIIKDAKCFSLWKRTQPSLFNMFK